jgi:lipopolysaccharide assembly outer membrane protein LptD (OstA)
MRQPSLLIVLWPLLAGACACQAQQGEDWGIQALGPQSRFESTAGTNVWSNGFIYTNQSSAVLFDKATEFEAASQIVVEGDVTILDHGRIWRGTNFIYNFKTGDVRAGRFKTMQAPFSISGQQMAGVSNKIQTATNAVISTDDYERPIYSIHARTATIAPGEYIEAHQATLYVGKMPLFYYPYYRRSLKQHPNNWEFVPGYRSLYGPYLLSAYNWYGTGLLDGTIHADERERRGQAFGPDLALHLGDWGEAAFRYYYAHDQDPGADGIVAPHLNENRQRANFFYEVHLASNVTAKVVANYQSDPLVIRDFFTGEYNRDVEPASFAEVNEIWPNWVLDGMAQPRLVNFFETVERLPDLKLTGLRQELGATPVYYESESSVGYFQRAFSETNVPVPFTNYTPLPNGLGYSLTRGTTGGYPNYTAARADTFHQFILPETFFGWLNVDPRAGGRATYYSDVDGPQIHTNQQGRGIFNTGVDVSFKASRVYPDAQSGLLDVNELRHIIQPEFDYVYVPTASTHVPLFDYQLPSLRLLPIDFPEYNSIDSITRENVLRLMLRNKLQTKRNDGIEDLVNWAVYTDWDLTPGTNHSFTDVYSDLEFRPRSWLTLSSSTRYDMPDTRWREAIERILIQPSTALSLSLGYYYLMNNDPEFQTYPGQNLPGHSLVDFSLYYRVNENWGAHIAERFEAQNGTMQQQIYSIYRDLRSWTAALIFSVNQGRGQPTDFTAGVTFSLKAFPRYKLNSDANQQSWLFNNSSTGVLDSYGR